MLTLDIYDDILKFCNVNKDNFKQILKWYNNISCYKFATGIDKPISLQELYQKYIEVFVSKSEFFSGIYLKPNDELIGIIKGGVNSRFHNSLWINSIIICEHFQNKGYGTRTINLVSEYFMKYYNVNNVYVSVLDKNIKARNFWSKLGFTELRKMNNHLIMDNQKQNVIIMGKKLNID